MIEQIRWPDSFVFVLGGPIFIIRALEYFFEGADFLKIINNECSCRLVELREF